MDDSDSKTGDWRVDCRKVLTVAGGTLIGGLAGCTSDDENGGSGQGAVQATATETGEPTSEPTESEPPTDSEEPTDSETPTDSGEPEIVIGKETFGVADFGYSEYPYYEAELTNQGDAQSGIVELVVDWFDENDEYVDDTTETLVSLNPGKTWIARSYNILSREAVVSAEASGNYDHEPPEWPDGLEVASSKLLSGQENVKVRATVENNTGRMVNYVAFYGKMFDADGNVLGQVWTNETELNDGSSWQAEREWDDNARAKLVEDHEVVLEGNIY